jgi:hypothetical protein
MTLPGELASRNQPQEDSFRVTNWEKLRESVAFPTLRNRRYGQRLE